METLVQFKLQDKMLKFENVLYIGASLIIAKHPKSQAYALFYRTKEFNDKEVKNALRKCGMRIMRKKSYQGVPYSELEVVGNGKDF